MVAGRERLGLVLLVLVISGLVAVAWTTVARASLTARFRDVPPESKLVVPPAIGTKLDLGKRDSKGSPLPQERFVFLLLPSCKSCSNIRIPAKALTDVRKLPLVLGLTDPTKWYGDDVKEVANGIPTLDVNSVGVIPHELLILSPCAVEIDADHRIVRYIAASELLVYLEELR